MYSGVVVFGVVFEVRMFRVSWPVMSVKALTNPPVVPTGALKMETSAHPLPRNVVPVHIHLPLTHAPFLLQ